MNKLKSEIISKEGCVFCNEKGFSFQRRFEDATLHEQIARGIETAKKRMKAEKHILYFQDNTNTYAPIEELIKKYDVIRTCKDVVMLAIGTRPDCVGDEVLSLINSYTDHYAK